MSQTYIIQLTYYIFAPGILTHELTLIDATVIGIARKESVVIAVDHTDIDRI